MAQVKRTPKKRAPQKYLTLPCLPFNQGKHTLLLLACSARQLWSIVEINRRAEDKEQGYQRALSERRARSLAKFIDDGNMLPVSVLVSFDEAEHDVAKNTLAIPERANAGWVIDGQHRLAGAHFANRDIILPVVAIVGATLTEQIDCFVTINKEHKGVPTSLYYELLKSLPKEKSEAEKANERAVEIAHELRSIEDSPFFGRILSTIAPPRGKLSLTNFVRKVAPLVKEGGPLMAFPAWRRTKAIDNYFRALAQVFPKACSGEASIAFKTLGFGALMNVFPTFLHKTIAEQKGFTVAHAMAVLNPMDHFKGSSGSRVGDVTV